MIATSPVVAFDSFSEPSACARRSSCRTNVDSPLPRSARRAPIERSSGRPAGGCCNRFVARSSDSMINLPLLRLIRALALRGSIRRSLQKSRSPESGDEQRSEKNGRPLPREIFDLPQHIREIALRKVVADLPQLLGGHARVTGNAVISLLAELRRDLVESARNVLQKRGCFLLTVCGEPLDPLSRFLPQLLTLALQRSRILCWPGRFRVRQRR